MAHSTSLGRRIFDRIGNPIDWGDADRCLLVAALTLPFLVSHFWMGQALAHRPNLAPYANRSFLVPFSQVHQALAIVWAGLVLYCLRARRRSRRSPWLVRVTIQLSALGNAFLIYCLGTFTSPAVVWLTGAVVGGGLLFEAREVLFGVATVLAILLGTSIAEQVGWIPYAPLLIEPPYEAGHLSPWWLAHLGTSLFFFWIATVGFFFFIVSRWRNRERRLREAYAELEREHAERKRLEKAVETLRVGVTISDPSGRILYANPAAAAMHGYAPDELVGRDLAILVVPETPHPLAAEQAGRLTGFKRETLNRRKDGTAVPVQILSDVVTSESGETEAVVTLTEDITERSLRDSLTGLPNRALFLDRLGHAMERMRGRASSSIAVLLLDIDRLKNINTTLGHAIGDELLALIASRLTSCLQAGDTVARIGDDEFGILLENLESVAEARRIADRAQKDLALPHVLGDRPIFVTASLGIAVGNLRYRRPEEMLRDADTALQRAKALGKGQCEVFDLDMRVRAVELLHLDTDLRRAIERGEFVLRYQPIVRLDTRRITAFEALLRWVNPTQGVVLPLSFIPFAEESGLIVPIGTWVLREACRQAREWRDRHPGRPPIAVSVNLSARQFSRPDLPELVAQALAETGLEPEGLKLEITEGVVMEDSETATATLARLKALRVGISIDDFGTGYSSLAYLCRLPVDTLKIDHSFVLRMKQDRESHAVVQTIVSLARSLKLDAIAEGVETEDQIAELLAMGCEYGQGVFAREPYSALDAGRLLEESP